MSCSFEAWRKDHPHFINDHVISADPKMPINDSKWGRVICKWIEKTETGKVEHIFSPVINLKNGDLYLDCSKKKIYAKLAAFSLYAPLKLTLKTIYHLILPVSLPLEIYKTVQQARKNHVSNGELAKRVFTAIGKNLADIIRTPLYAIALVIISIGGLLIGPMAPETLYDVREVISKVERSLHWDSSAQDMWDKNGWTVFYCFQSDWNVMEIRELTYEQLDTEYLQVKAEDNATVHGLSNRTRGNINKRRKTRLPGHCCQLLPADQRYISPAVQGIYPKSS